MTRADVDHASLGSPSAARTVVVLREGPLATLDPDPAVTRRRDVRVVAVRIDVEAMNEPTSFGDREPGHVSGLESLLADIAPDPPIALVAVGAAGSPGIALAAALGDDVDRLVLVGVPAPEAPLSRGETERTLTDVTARTLLLNGQRDPDAAAAAAEWHRRRLVSARVEMIPARDEASDPRISLTDVWERVLSHAAPRTTKRE